MERLFKSILEQDKAPIVVCDIQSTVVYMNPSAIARYKRDLTGRNLKICHPAAANEKIDRVLEWFGKSVIITSFTPTATTKKIKTSIWLHFVMTMALSLVIMRSTNTEIEKWRNCTIYKWGFLDIKNETELLRSRWNVERETHI